MSFVRDLAAGERRDGIGAGAALIGGITAASRVVGFGRVLVLTWAVGIGGVLDVYNTASRVPNILYEVVAGGALSSVVVPLVAGPLARREPGTAERAASGLLTWSLLILVPAAALVAALARPIMSLLDGSGDPGRIALGAAMIRVFAPQLPLYGVGVVLSGVLHAHRRFAWPALAPLLSSLTVIGAYAWYGAHWRGSPVATLDAAGRLVLSIGTTTATVVMTGCLLIPLRRIGFRWRPTVRFGPGLSRRVRVAALAGGAGVAAWQLSLLLNLGLTNAGPTGTVTVYTIALTVYLLPWGVLAVPLALASYPVLSAAHDTGDHGGYSRVLAQTVRRVLLAAGLGAAVLIGAARPIAGGFAALGGDGPRTTDALADTIAALAPGLFGFGLFALLTRALYARGSMAAAATAGLIGWATSYIAAVVCAEIAPVPLRAVAVAVGNTTGMVVLGAVLLWTVARRVGRLDGVLRAGLTALAAAAPAAAAGRLAAGAWGRHSDLGGSIVAGLVGGCATLAIFGVMTYVCDRRDIREALTSLVERPRRKRPRPTNNLSKGDRP